MDAMQDEGDCYTVIGFYDDSGDTTVSVIPRDAAHADPHWAALRHAGDFSRHGEFEIVALLKGRVEILVTQQSLRVYAERLLDGS